MEWLPDRGPRSVFLFDNFEENLISSTVSFAKLTESEGLPVLEDAATARFLSDLIYAGKSRILITCRYPFQLPDLQHRGDGPCPESRDPAKEKTVPGVGVDVRELVGTNDRVTEIPEELVVHVEIALGPGADVGEVQIVPPDQQA